MSAKWSKRPPLRDGARVTAVYRYASMDISATGLVHHNTGAAQLSHERATVRGNGRHRRALAPMSLVHLTAASEGITWCRGWTGREVDALRTTTALS